MNASAVVREEAAKLGLDVRLEGEGEGAVLNVALPRGQARALRKALEARGLVASDAPDGDDRSLAWVYAMVQIGGAS